MAWLESRAVGALTGDGGRTVNDRTRVITGAMIGALAGGMMVFFAFTDRGRDALRRAGPALDDLAHTLEELRSIVQAVDGSVQEARLVAADIQAALARNEPPGNQQDSPRAV